MKRCLSIALVSLHLTWAGLTLFSGCSAPKPVSGAKAAIIDQLSVLQPNQAFLAEVTADLEAYGFNVDVYLGEEANVKLYKELPKHGYKLIVFRAHSGFMVEEQSSQPKEAIYLFTGETYSKIKYVREQLTDQMLEAKTTEDSPTVFAINYKFVLNSMEGRFDNTIIIMMGCSTTERPDMAISFIRKGASTYLGWNASVGLNYVDEATFDLISNLTIKGMMIDEAVRETRARMGPYPKTNAQLQYYPAKSGSHTIKELISRVD